MDGSEGGCASVDAALTRQEYQDIDHQLDQIDAVLTVLESRQKNLHQEAQQLLVDARAAREEGEGPKEEKCPDSDVPEK